jgi:hypothetical protein
MEHVFEFDFSDFLVEHAVGFLDFEIPFLKESVFTAALGEWVDGLGGFVGAEYFFGDRVEGLLVDGGRQLEGKRSEGVVDAPVPLGVAFH